MSKQLIEQLEKQGTHITYELQYRKCSKKGCHCQQGSQHGPYMYAYWREGGRLKSAYIGNPDIKESKPTLHSALMQLQALNAALRITPKSVAIWCPGKCVPRFIRSTIRENKDIVAAMIRIARIEVCCSPELHRHEWYFAGPEWTVESATCAICERLDIVG